MEEEIVNNNDNKQENMEISEETIQVVEQSKYLYTVLKCSS